MPARTASKSIWTTAYRISLDPYQYTNIDFMPNGHFQCESHGDVWCQDIKSMIDSYWDAETFWNLVEDWADIGTLKVQVPMFPELNIWEEVELIPKESSTTSKVIMFEVFRTKAAFGEGNDYGWREVPQLKNDYSLGFLSPGEFIGSLRIMITNWFEVVMHHIRMRQSVGTKFECRSRTHGMSQEAAWKAQLAKGRSMGEYFIVWKTDQCRSCLSGQADPSASDLIPDVNTGGPKPWDK